ncbi:MAG: SAM-dependent methyltransferase [Halobacteriales archaeon]|nr:SAM-dependent methyltransferase [Halobacteriales archaeon]
MSVPCVRVPPEQGETTRAMLADRNLVHDEYDITVDRRLALHPRHRPRRDLRRARSRPRSTRPRRETQTSPDGYPRLRAVATNDSVDIVILDEDDAERARAIADAVMASDAPRRRPSSTAPRRSRVNSACATGTCSRGDGTETVHREYGYRVRCSTSPQVYFSPRLATERHRVTEQVARRRARVRHVRRRRPVRHSDGSPRRARSSRVDLNPRAVEYLRENAERNGVADRVTAIEGDVREVAADYAGWADRARDEPPAHARASSSTPPSRSPATTCVLHYYDIQHDSDPFGPGERGDSRGRRRRVRRRGRDRGASVRSYAPHEENVCLDARALTRSASLVRNPYTAVAITIGYAPE